MTDRPSSIPRSSGLPRLSSRLPRPPQEEQNPSYSAGGATGSSAQRKTSQTTLPLPKTQISKATAPTPTSRSSAPAHRGRAVPTRGRPLASRALPPLDVAGPAQTGPDPGSRSGPSPSVTLNERTIETLSQLPSSPSIHQRSDSPLVPSSHTPTRLAPSLSNSRPPLKKSSSRSSLGVSPVRPSSAGLDRPAPAPLTSGYASKTLSARPSARQRPPASPALFKKPQSATPRKPLSISPSSTPAAVASANNNDASTIRKSSAALREQIAKAKAAKRAGGPSQATQSRVGAIAPDAPVVPSDDTFDFGLSDDPFGQLKFENTNRNVLQTRIAAARASGRLNIAAMGLREIPDDVRNMYKLDDACQNNSSWAESVDLVRLVAADNELESVSDTFFPDTAPTPGVVEFGQVDDDDDDDDAVQHIFAGLEFLDLHNNPLTSLPVGIRRLQFLTSLNLSHAKLANTAIEIISQVPSLRDLKISNNSLTGPLDASFTNLTNLEIADLHDNALSSLPQGIGNMPRLRILNVSENALQSIPFEDLSKLPLTELLARKNKLSGTLFPENVDYLGHLQILDVVNNQLTRLSAGALVLPSLHQLSVSINRLEDLPNLGSWTSLLTINADENSLAKFPEGLTRLEKLRHIDLTSNDIRTIPVEVGAMEGLAMLRIAGNPLREKKFTSLSTEEVKTTLAARLDPLPEQEPIGIEHFANGFDRGGGKGMGTMAMASTGEGPTNRGDERANNSPDLEDSANSLAPVPQSPIVGRPSSTAGVKDDSWPIKAGGVLDRSGTQSSSLHPVICSRLAADTIVRDVRLDRNTMSRIPESLSFFADALTTLSISHNQLLGDDYMGGDAIELQVLRDLNLASNRIISLDPLMHRLRAPRLEKLDVSLNRIVQLPMLRHFFPELTVLLASNNHMEELDPDCIAGMTVVDVGNNDIAHLNPRIGLLGGSGGKLSKLDVMGNRFRVPRWNVLERGTEATLRWLRGRVPVAEMAEWRAHKGNDDDGSQDDGDVD